MKTLVCLICAFVCIGALRGQTAGEEIATKIAQRMKDSLQLTDSQQVQIYQINIQLNQQKIGMRNQYSGTDSLRIKIQQVENTRDPFYLTILSEEQYYLYRQKKRNLVNNN